MFHPLYKLLLIFTINLIISVPLYARIVEQKELNFKIDSESLLKGDIHYFFSIMSPREFAARFADVYELDSLALNQETGVMMVLNKSVVIVNKPVGFFDDKQMSDEKYVAHISGEQKVKKTGPETFKVTVPGETGYNYKMQLFFDADDVSTLPNSKVIRAVSAAKKLDVISQSASTIMFAEKTNYSKYTEAGVTVSSFIPMKENQTLIITYNLYAVKNKFALEKVLKLNFIQEVEAVKALQESFKP